MRNRIAMLSMLLILVLLAGCASQQNEDMQSSAAENENASIETAVPDSKTTEADSEVIEEEPQPVYADQIADGTYEITVDSSASMFRVVDCELLVENDAMYAVMTMSGKGYGMVYMGTSEDALLDAEDSYIPFEFDEDGAKTFTVPVEALNMEIDCAAWSIKKEKWYDRTLVFLSDAIPADAIMVE